MLAKSTVCDCDVIFTSAFLKELFHLQGTELLMSSAYHPQKDGQTEWVNCCVETYLRCLWGHQPKQRVLWLSWAEWCYNTSFHESIKMSPFEVVYGQSPPSVEAHVQGTTRVHHV